MDVDGIKRYALVCYKSNDGSIVTTLSGISLVTLRMWAMREVVQNQEALIFDEENGRVLYHVVGNKDFPETIDLSENGEEMNIESVCPGLLKAYKESISQ